MTDRELMQQALEALERFTILRERLAQTEQEPVGEVLDERGEVDWISFVPPAGTSLYTAPPQKEWVGLTYDDISEAIEIAYKRFRIDKSNIEVGICHAIEAKLKEKNHG